MNRENFYRQKLLTVETFIGGYFQMGINFDGRNVLGWKISNAGETLMVETFQPGKGPTVEKNFRAWMVSPYIFFRRGRGGERHLRVQLLALGRAALAVLGQAGSQLQRGRKLQTATARCRGVRLEVCHLALGICGDAGFLVLLQLAERILSHLSSRPPQKTLQGSSSVFQVATPQVQGAARNLPNPTDPKTLSCIRVPTAHLSLPRFGGVADPPRRFHCNPQRPTLTRPEPM